MSHACWIVSSKSDILYRMILYHISTSRACWIVSSKSDILNFMILYHTPYGEINKISAGGERFSRPYGLLHPKRGGYPLPTAWVAPRYQLKHPNPSPDAIWEKRPTLRLWRGPCNSKARRFS